jgi:prepilin-type N-terminal cleavage/methylation domain-containing protein
MKSKAGFTLIELMVVMAILGVMGATAVPLYRTYQQRAYGSQAALMAKQLIDAEIMYFLEHDKFFPEDSTITLHIPADNPPSAEHSQMIQDIKNALNVTITPGKILTYQINSGDDTAADWCQVRIWATFPLFKDGRNDIVLHLTSDGRVLPF